MNSQNNAIPHPGRRNAQTALRLRLAGRVVETVDGVWSVSHSQTANLSHAENADTAFSPHAALTKLLQYKEHNYAKLHCNGKQTSSRRTPFWLMRMRCLRWIPQCTTTPSWTNSWVQCKPNSRQLVPRKTEYGQPNPSNYKSVASTSWRTRSALRK